MTSEDGGVDRGSGQPRAQRDFRVPRVLRAAEVLFAQGGRVSGRVFLPATSESHAGAMRAEEWINEPVGFFPFLPDGDDAPIILGKQGVLVLTVAASADQNDALEQVPVPSRHVVVECGPLRFAGEVLLDLPVDRRRVLDLLNHVPAFVNVRDGTHHHLINKARITRVIEPRDPVPAA